MNWKQFFIAAIVGLIALLAMDFVINVLILGGIYAPFKGTIFRTDEAMNSRMWAMILGEIIFVAMFVWIYTFGLKGKGAVEGLRYGLYVGLLFSPVSALGTWATVPINAAITWSWMISGLIETMILGLIIGAIYKTVRA